MKLFWCKKCGDVIALGMKVRFCECKKAAARYEPDRSNAVYTNNAVMFAIDNYSFFARMKPKEITNQIYDQMYGKKYIQCWIMNKDNPNFTHIRKVKLSDLKKEL